MPDTDPVPNIPTIPPVSISPSPLLSATLKFVRAHSTPAIYNHVLRTTYLSFLALQTQHHLYSDASPKVLLLASLTHDLGWDYSKELVSHDKRYEVDGGDAAIAFLKSEPTAKNELTEQELSTIWHAIAMHTVPSIATYSPSPEVRIIELVSGADFYGPSTPGGWITKQFWDELLKAFPRLGFREEFKNALCGLCREKPETTRDNFVADFGEWLVDGYERGTGRARRLDEAIRKVDEETEEREVDEQ